MYNEEIKIRFLDQYKEQDDAANSNKKNKGYDHNARQALFELVEPMEAEQSKDIGDMTLDEIIDILDRIGGSSYVAVVRHVKFLRQYLTWYNENINPSRYVQPISWKMVDLVPWMKQHLVGDPHEIIRDWGDFRPEDGYFYQPAHILMWYGMDVTDVCNLKKSEVQDLGDCIQIRTSKHSIDIRDEGLMAVLRAFENFGSVETKYTTWVRANTDRYITRRIRDTDDDESAVLTRKIIYTNTWAFKSRRPDLLVRYESNNFRNASIYWRVIQHEKEVGKRDEEFVKQLTGTQMRYPWYNEAFWMSLEKYREAFQL